MSTVKLVFLVLLAAFVAAAGVMHFVKPERYVAAMPPYIPWHEEIVEGTGVLEVIFAIALLVPWTRKAAARGLVLFFIAIFPANIQMALEPEKHGFPAWMLYVRLPLQLPLIWWAYWMSLPRDGES
jgi:uncharacterized membrane protein